MAQEFKEWFRRVRQLEDDLTDISAAILAAGPPESRGAAYLEQRLLGYFRNSEKHIRLFNGNSPRYEPLLEAKCTSLSSERFEELATELPVARREAIRQRIKSLLQLEMKLASTRHELNTLKQAQQMAQATTISRATPKPSDIPDAGAQQKRRRRKPVGDPSTQAIRQTIRDCKKDGLSAQEICARLGDSPRPPKAAWNALSWPKAFTSKRFRAAVKTYIAKA